jgi:hypothetical protein
VISQELKKQLKMLDEKAPVDSVTAEVAQVLNISVNTVNVHIRVLCEAFEARNRTRYVFMKKK